MAKRRTDAERRIRQSDRLARVLRLLQLIQSHGQWNAETIAKELDVSERTVYRDLHTLTSAGIPWYFDEYTQSYRIRQNFQGPFPKFPPMPKSESGRTSSERAAEDDPRSIVTLATEAAQRLLVEAEGVVQALDRLAQAIEHVAGRRPK
jgi:predicted DNA-binding transcriptional regulator YafY